MVKVNDFSFGSIVTDDEFNEQAGDALAADPTRRPKRLQPRHEGETTTGTADVRGGLASPRAFGMFMSEGGKS